MRKWLVKERKKESEVSEDFIRSVEVEKSRKNHF